MGSRGRSIRLRIYFLVAIPLITMLGLFGYVAYSSVSNWLNLDRAPSLIQATSEPLTNFVNVLQAERRAAVVYLSQPDAANLISFQTAAATTEKDAQQLELTLSQPATTDNSTPAETAAINNVTGQINGMTPLRTEVTAKKLTPLDAASAYTNIIAGQGAVLQAEANSLQDAAPVLQGLGLISAVNTQEDMSEQDAVLASALASGTLTGADRVAFSNAVGRQQNDTLSYQQLLTPAEVKTYTATLNRLAPKSVQDQLATIQQAIPAGLPLSGLEQQGLSSASWPSLTSTWLEASNKAGTVTATAVLKANAQPAIDAKRRVWITGAVGVAGLILTLIVTILLGQSINRRLTALRRSALTLAQEQLPAVVARLRRGESVDVAAEAPPLRAGNDEIGQVGEAIDTVRQTAIRSAVEEARVRQGVNDMFRNLARRSQSLLQRQLTVLDNMERRATDPDVLEDLFKMDHLTTRMRRHAEGLIILSGAPPGRSWSTPVKLIDVMRGAVAEVEDYARVTATTQARAALSGSAVTDVIHLLAELIENATSLSPPFTQVRVSGETVANGFAIEIEDRGLGMTPERLQELNERLANPPDLNPANTEQLGLFVVGQLARRHGIRVVLHPSPYSGTTAVAVIPSALIVEEGPAAIDAGGRPPAAAGSAAGGFHGSGPSGSSSYGNGYTGAVPGPAPVNGYAGAAHGPAAPGGQPAELAANGWPAGAGAGANGRAEAAGGYFTPSAVPSPPATPVPPAAPVSPGLPARPAVPAAYSDAGRPPAGAGYPAAGSAGPRDLPADPRDLPADPGGHDTEQDAAGPPIRISGALRHLSATSGYAGLQGTADPAPATAENGTRRRRHSTEEIPVVADVPVRPPAAPPVPTFDVFTPIRRPGQDSAPAADESQAADVTPAAAVAPAADDGQPAEGADDFQELPRRVRQASLAPQLRVSAAVSGAPGAGAVPAVTAASLSDMRNTLSAMQRGWQQGRIQTQPDSEGQADGS
jgi:signal transduction histidine kinase